MNKLYSKDSNGNIRVWWMEVEREKYRTVSGVLDGQLVYSEWTTAKAKNIGKKNETSAEEQALAEVQSKYKKQLKTGYSENIDNAGKTVYVKPMLAKQYKDYKDKVDFTGWIMQIKYNGVRCIATKDGLFSREGEKYLSCPHISSSLEKFFEQYPNAVLDGELFNYDLRQKLNELIKLVRKTKNITEYDLEQSQKLVSYYIYDGYGFDDLDTTKDSYYTYRYMYLTQLDCFNSDYINFTKCIIAKNKDDIESTFQNFISEGHEGLMLRNPKGPYKHGRSADLLKMKPEDDDEFTILEIKEGEGNWSGKAKIITVQNDAGEVFDASFKGDMELAAQVLAEKDKYIGKKYTFKYFGFTGLGTPNYCQWDFLNSVEHT